MLIPEDSLTLMLLAAYFLMKDIFFFDLMTLLKADVEGDALVAACFYALIGGMLTLLMPPLRYFASKR